MLLQLGRFLLSSPHPVTSRTADGHVTHSIRSRHAQPTVADLVLGHEFAGLQARHRVPTVTSRTSYWHVTWFPQSRHAQPTVTSQRTLFWGMSLLALIWSPACFSSWIACRPACLSSPHRSVA
eukprot:963922-Rhodomonas_salina.9